MALAGEVRTSLEPGVVSYKKPAYNSEGERNTDSCSDDNRRIPLPVNQNIHSVEDELPGIVETQVREEINEEPPASPSGEPGEFDARNLLTEVVLDKDSTSPAESDQGACPRDRQRLNVTSCPNSSSDAASEHGSCHQRKKRRVPAKNRNVRKEATKNQYQITRSASRNTAMVGNFQSLLNVIGEQISGNMQVVNEKLDAQGCMLDRVVNRMEEIEIKVSKLENTVLNQQDKISREIEEVKTEAKTKRDTKKNRSIEHYNNLAKANEMKIANEKTELIMQKLNKIESTLANVLPHSTMLCNDPRSSNFAGEKNVRSSENDSKSMVKNSLLKGNNSQRTKGKRPVSFICLGEKNVCDTEKDSQEKEVSNFEEGHAQSVMEGITIPRTEGKRSVSIGGIQSKFAKEKFLAKIGHRRSFTFL